MEHQQVQQRQEHRHNIQVLVQELGKQRLQVDHFCILLHFLGFPRHFFLQQGLHIQVQGQLEQVGH